MRVSDVTPDIGVDLHYRDAMQPDEAGVKQLGVLIKQARLARRWTQKDLAEESGVSIETIKRYENGKIREPEREPVRNIIRALNVDPREIPIALGLVTREEMGLPPTPTHRQPLVQRIIEALEDPDVTDRERDAIAALLEARRGQQTRQAPRKTG